MRSCHWLGLEAMSRLARLGIGSNSGEGFCADASLAALTALQHLELAAAEDEVAGLPPSLTSLFFGGYRGYRLPHQVGAWQTGRACWLLYWLGLAQLLAQPRPRLASHTCPASLRHVIPLLPSPHPALQVATLARLQVLRFWDAQFDAPEGLRPLQHLSGCLTELSLRHCSQVPSGLSRLTSLARLAIVGHSWKQAEEDWEQPGPDPGLHVVAALPHLQRLRRLALSPMPGCWQPPAALAGATQLQSFFWMAAEGMSALLDECLPPGSWLAGLQQLSGPADVLANSLPALVAARGLCVLGVEAFNAAVPAGVLEWAGRLPALSRFVLGASAAEAARAADVLRGHRPGLLDCGVHDVYSPLSLQASVWRALAARAASRAPVASLLLAFLCFTASFQLQRCLLRACIVSGNAF